MLADANEISQQFSGQGSMWQNPFATPNPRGAVDTASVWFTAYPLSLITRPDESFLKAMANELMWQAFAEIGIEAIHTGPVKRAGGISGWQYTPSVDGHFDRISTQIDPAFGTEDEFRQMCATATWYGGTIIDDIVPGHTGKGSDFRLAEMKYADYPGIYHMVEIDPRDWHELPEVPAGADSVNIDAVTEEWLDKAGYIIGRLQRVIFYAEGVKVTNWSVTRPVTGVDGVARRWVYLHYFKDGQPSINWLDPSFAGMRMVIGGCSALVGRPGHRGRYVWMPTGSSASRRPPPRGSTAWSEGHPLSEAANHLIASMVRKVGGFTFQELNLTIDDIRQIGEAGADLSYDFVNRPAYQHALATADTEFLRLTLRTTLELGGRSCVAGARPAEPRRTDLRAAPLGERPPRRHLHLQSGRPHGRTDRRIGTQRPDPAVDRRGGALQPGLHHQRHRLHDGIGRRRGTGYRRPRRDRGHRPHPPRAPAAGDVQRPAAGGVFALSGWDLCGMLTLPISAVSELVAGGGTPGGSIGPHTT